MAPARPGLVQARLRVRLALADPAALGLLGSILVAIGSLGVGIVPKPDPVSHLPLIGLLRLTLPGQALSTASVIVGIAILLAAWLAMGRHLRAGVGPSLGRMRRMLWLWTAPLLLTPPLFSRDSYSYAAQGNLVRHGYDAYVVGPWVIPGPFADSVDPIWATTPAPYGPVFLELSAGIARLTGDSVYFGVLGMRLLALAGVWILLRYLPRLAQCGGVDPRGALWLGLVNPLTVMHFVSGAHNDALMIALIVAGLTLAVEASRRASAARANLGFVAASVAIALAAGVKAPAAVILAFIGHLWAGRLRGEHRLFRGFALAGGIAGGVFVALTAITGVGYGWIAALGTPGSVRTWLSPPTALGMLAGGIGQLLGRGNHTWDLVDLSRSLSGLLAVVLIGILAFRPRGVSPVRDAAATLFVIVALGPVVQPWYLMWALIPFAAVGVRRGREGVLLCWALIGAVVISQLNGSTMIGPFAVPGTTACVLATALVVIRARRAEADLFGGDAVFDLDILRPHAQSATPGGTHALIAAPSRSPQAA